MSKIIALILCRGNSKGIKNKNLIKFSGKPLLYWTIKSLKSSKLIKEIYVSSDSKKILNFASQQKVKTILRPKKISKDNSKSEEALLHSIKHLNLLSGIIIFPQVTSPLRPKNIFDKAINQFKKKKLDSLFSSTIVHSFTWEKKKDILTPNYNYKNRPMRQEFNNLYQENGSFYIFKTKGFLKEKNRLFGKIGTYLLDKKYSFQIDDRIDLKINGALK